MKGKGKGRIAELPSSLLRDRGKETDDFAEIMSAT